MMCVKLGWGPAQQQASVLHPFTMHVLIFVIMLHNNIRS